MLLVVAATERELVGVEGTTCGIGPVDAAANTARILAEKRPAAVLHVGLAGSHGFADPELVLGSESLYCDAESRLVTATVHPNDKLFGLVSAALPDVRVCPIGTSARVNGTTDCAVEGMEGFAVLRACELAGVPAVELRVTSNEISEPDRARWRFDDALALLRETLPGLLEGLDA